MLLQMFPFVMMIWNEIIVKTWSRLERFAFPKYDTFKRDRDQKYDTLKRDRDQKYDTLKRDCDQI